MNLVILSCGYKDRNVLKCACIDVFMLQSIHVCIHSEVCACTSCVSVPVCVCVAESEGVTHNNALIPLRWSPYKTSHGSCITKCPAARTPSAIMP